MHRTYANEDITVFWNSDKCRHARMCVNGCPGVFEFGRRPWVILENGENGDIWKTVKKCPSGALDITYNHDVRIEYDEAGCRSVAYLGDARIGECDYRDTGDAFNIYHTEVAPEHGGKGIARRLVYCVIEAAERSKKSIIPTCSYAARVLNEG
ncbi:MAG: (4Fe-4S)-binding protein [Lachnospiraceae bacterium]|nr:(4Fe-4S)-binding protein [Lachnospiraceae bacterium]